MTSKKIKEYSFDTLFEDILSECANNFDISEKYKREYGEKLIVIKLLLSLGNLYKINKPEEIEKLNREIELKLNHNDILSGYIFFVSQRKQFDHLWSYMRWNKDRYKEFLINSIRFFSNILVDINMLRKEIQIEENIHAIFHDILDVEFISQEPYVKTRFLWENFQKLVTIQHKYTICIKIKDNVLKVANRQDTTDTKKNIKTIFNKRVPFQKNKNYEIIE